MALFEKPITDAIAAAYLQAKKTIGTYLKTAEIAKLWTDTAKARSFFSARVASVDILEGIKKRTKQVLAGDMSEQQARSWIRDFIESKGDTALTELGFLPSETAKATKKLSELGSTRRLKLIVEQNVRQAQATGEYKRHIDNADIMPYLQYNSAKDERVRSSHKSLDGKIYPVDSEVWDEIYPPNGFNCRCYVVPLMKNEVDINDVSETIPASYDTEDNYSFNPKNGFTEPLEPRKKWDKNLKNAFNKSTKEMKEKAKKLKEKFKWTGWTGQKTIN